MSGINLKCGEFIIINLDFCFEPGSHWISVKVFEKTIEIYDSLGMTSREWFRPPYFIFNFLSQYFKTHSIFITPHIQNSFSSVCGQYVLFFLVSSGDLDEKLSYFSKSKTFNDITVQKKLGTSY